MTDPTKRFSDRVRDYIKYRPDYPAEIISFLEEKIGFSKKWIVADIGSGTGILSRLFLKNNNKVYCVEPNKEMREAGEKEFGKYSNFISIDGKAESSKLYENSIDIITAGQAFHWFDLQETRKEFSRILKDDGYVVLIWNDRKTDADRFAKEYEKLVNDFGTDYKKVDHKNVTEEILRSFYKTYDMKVFTNYQDLDYKGLRGRLGSSSYLPGNSHPDFNKMMKRAEEIFRNSQVNGLVRIKYNTKLYFGKI